jgi:hypothetical protein
MRTAAVIAFVVGIVGLPVWSGEKKKSDVVYQVFDKGYFVKNTAKLSANPAFLLLPDKKAFDEIFGVGFVMKGARPNLVTDKLFEKNTLVTVIKSGNTLWKYEVRSVRLDKQRLVVRYTAEGKESATAKFNSPLILSVPRGDYTEVVFMEGDKEIGKVAVKK